MRKLILHVGPHKTGSTYLQHCLARNRVGLAEAGILHPGTERRGRGFNLDVAAMRWLRDAADLDAAVEGLGAGIPDTGTLLWSSENFSHLTPDKLARVAARFEGRDVEVIFHLRRLHGLWPSSWQSRVRHGADHSFEEYLLAASGSEETDIVPQARQIEAMIAAFGRPSLRIFVYDNLMAAGEDLFAHFLCEVLGLDPGTFEIPRGLSNPSYSPVQIELVRCLNMRQRDRTGSWPKPGTALRAAYWRDRERIEASEAFRGFAEAFERFAAEITIAADTPFILRAEDRILAAFGDLIENRHSDAAIFTAERAPRTVRACSRHWIHAAGVVGAVDDILDRLARDAGGGRPPATP